MRRALRWSALALFGLLALFMLWFGVTYASVQNMLWFHAAAVPEAAHGAIKPLYLALMTLIGGASISVAVLSGYLILGPIRRGDRGAATVLAAALGFGFVIAAVTAEKLSAAGAPTSWHIMGVLLAITVAAYAAHVAAKAK